ncbi:MAG: nitroreductase family deazaflavin-dependent oxidoreductase [Acidimicrobiia bacterium]|nr:nitroreductase family deazaflavin-dependent oxidoreductase [Acidimicrobiia bacterium]
MTAPRIVLRLLKLPPRLIYAIGLGRIYGRFVLLLTTSGRRTGQRRVTPLQYERIQGNVVVASVRGTEADWVRNLIANPTVEVQVGRQRFSGVAQVDTDAGSIADFIELRFHRHPWMVGGIMRLDGIPRHPQRSQLQAYAGRLALITITPDAPGDT